MRHWTVRWKRLAGRLVVLSLAALLLIQGAAARPEAQQAWPGRQGPAAAEASGVLEPSNTLISYQGTLTDPNGNPIDEILPMEFALYAVEDGGTPIWGPELQSVQVTDSLFNVLLGSVLPIDPGKLGGDLWLDIKVNGEQLTPRERLTTVPYAAEAGTLPSGAQTQGSLQVNGHLVAFSPDSGYYGLGLTRTDEENRTHKWRFWHMNQQYGMNSLQIYEYRTDSSGIDCGGNAGDGAICQPRFTILQGGNVGIGTTTPSRELYVYRNSTGPNGITIENGLATNAESPAQIDFKRTAVADSQWASVGMDHTARDFFIWVNGADRLNIDESGTTRLSGTLDMQGNSVVNCGALTEANLQTPAERAAGRSDRFEEGDVLCWGIDRLEKCTAANDRLVQAVADKSGRPIIIGAEVIKVLGPVKRGDTLVASGVPGYAMVNNDPASGSVIAQALEDFDGKQGLIKAMIRKW